MVSQTFDFPDPRTAIIEAHIYTLVTAQAWSDAVTVCREWIEQLQYHSTNERLADAYYKSSIIASHAGETEAALAWIDEAHSLAGKEQPLAPRILQRFQARKGYILSRLGSSEKAICEFRSALEISLSLEDLHLSVEMYENIRITANQDLTLHSDVLNELVPVATRILHREQKLHDIHEGLESVEEGRLYDALSHYLIAFHVGLETNSIQAVTRAQRRLASLLIKSGHIWNALPLLLELGDIKEVKALCSSICGHVDPNLPEAACELFHRQRATPWERAAVAAAITELADIIPDTEVPALVRQMVSDFHSIGANGKMSDIYLSAIANLVARSSGPIFTSCIIAALQTLKERSPRAGRARSAALSVIAHGRKRLPSKLQRRVVKALMHVLSDNDTRAEALRCLVFIASYLEKEHQDEIRHMVSNLALEKRQIDACRHFVSSEYGRFPDNMAQRIIDWYIERMRDQIRMVEERHWRMNDIYNLRTIDDFKEYINDSNARVVTSLLSDLSMLADNTLGCREDAIAGLGRIAAVIPNDQIKAVFHTLVSISTHVEIGGVIQLQQSIGFATYDRFNIEWGDIESVRRAAYISLGQLCPRLSKSQLRDAIMHLLNATGDASKEVRKGAALGLKAARECLKRESRIATTRQLYAMLHEAAEEVQQAATYCLMDYAGDLSPRDARFCVNRLSIMLTTNSLELRVNIIYLLGALFRHPSLSDRAQQIDDLVRSRNNDPSHRVRAAVVEVLNSRRDVNILSG